MSNDDLVSCIIIFFNAEKFLEEAIESVLDQSYEHWELLLADDGSSDASTEMAQRYTRQYPDKVRYLEHEGHQNHGMSATRNLGLRNALGKYIAFLDADDVWLTEKLAQQTEIMQMHPEAGMVYGRSLYWQSWMDPSGSGQSNPAQQDYIPKAYVPGDKLYHPATLANLSYPLGKATPPPPTDIMLRRDAIEAVGGFEEGFQDVYQLYEDQAFFAKLYLSSSVFVSNECWDKYRQHPNSISSQVNDSGQYHQVRLFFLNWFENYLNHHKIENKSVRDACRKALLRYRRPFLFKINDLIFRIMRRLKSIGK